MSESPNHMFEAAGIEPLVRKSPSKGGPSVSLRMWCWLVGGGLLVACVTTAVIQYVRPNAYYKDVYSGQDMIRQVLNRRPPDVDPSTWGTACDWVTTAYANVCFSPNHVSHDELRRFLTDLEGQLRGPVNLATWDWVWGRLGRTGPHGRSYQQEYEPIYRLDIREHLEAAEKNMSARE